MLVSANASKAPAAPSSSAKTPTADAVKAMIARSHEIHGKGRAMWFHFEGKGRRGSCGHSGPSADVLQSADPMASNVASYDVL